MMMGGRPGATGGNGGQRIEPQVGGILGHARQALGQSLSDVARDLRIRRTFLEAIEAGRYDGLPGAAYTLGFIRTYAEYLGLDGDEIVRRFKAESGQAAAKSKLNFPSPMSESTAPKAAYLLVGLLIAGVAYGIWYLSSSQYLDVAEVAVPLPDHLRKLLPGEEGGIVASVPPAASQPNVNEPQAAQIAATIETPPQTPPVPSSSLSSPPTVVPAEVTTAAAPAAAVADSRTPPGEASPPTAAAPPAEPANRIVLRASADSWVEVREAGSRTALLSRLMKAGETFAVPDRPGLTLMTGNAGGLDVLVDGQTVPPLGKPGTVRRGVALDPDLLKSAPPTAAN